MKRIFGKKALFVLLIILIGIAAGAPSFYFYTRYREVQTQLMSESSREEASQVLASARRHILMPEGEEPTILTVTDKDKLSGQQFYANAKNGDKVIVFYQAKKAFLYDPQADRILEVGPVLATESASVAGSQTTTPAPPAKQDLASPGTPTPAPVRFVILNGTTTVGLTRRYEATLTRTIDGAVVIDRDNAKKQDYETSVIVDLAGSNPKAQEVAQALSLDLVKLPSGETKPDPSPPAGPVPDGTRAGGAGQAADFLIILGEDKK